MPNLYRPQPLNLVGFASDLIRVKQNRQALANKKQELEAEKDKQKLDTQMSLLNAFIKGGAEDEAINKILTNISDIFGKDDDTNPIRGLSFTGRGKEFAKTLSPLYEKFKETGDIKVFHRDLTMVSNIFPKKGEILEDDIERLGAQISNLDSAEAIMKANPGLEKTMTIEDIAKLQETQGGQDVLKRLVSGPEKGTKVGDTQTVKSGRVEKTYEITGHNPDGTPIKKLIGETPIGGGGGEKVVNGISKSQFDASMTVVKNVASLLKVPIPSNFWVFDRGGVDPNQWIKKNKSAITQIRKALNDPANADLKAQWEQNMETINKYTGVDLSEATSPPSTSSTPPPLRGKESGVDEVTGTNKTSGGDGLDELDNILFGPGGN